MEQVVEQLDDIERRVINGLKDFQVATVNRIDYLFRHGKNRVLVSDEVGLGKTLVARGVIARFAQLRKEEGDNLVKVVYVCSNAAIADQNINKLAITQDVQKESIGSSRLSMQHINIFSQENDPELLRRYIQLIPLTPDTSFRMTQGTGTKYERALMYAVLKDMDFVQGRDAELRETLRCDVQNYWNGLCEEYIGNVEKVNAKSNGAYLTYMHQNLEVEFREPFDEKQRKSYNSDNFEEYFLWILDQVSQNRVKDIKSSVRAVVGRLRLLFAKVSLEKLEPDLVIMDEFQRFKDLITANIETDMGMLAHKFFSAGDVRMLLLSATPYKMYSTMEEIDVLQKDEHFREFNRVMRFLNQANVVQGKLVDEYPMFKTVWNNYSVKLKELDKGNEGLLLVKNQAEDALYNHVCRTERDSEKRVEDIINTDEVKIPITVTVDDIESYLQMHKLLDEMGVSFQVPIDYIKSSPYLLSFMQGYRLKEKIEAYFAENNQKRTNLLKRRTFWLRQDQIANYEKLNNNNARLDVLMKHAFKDNAARLLWVPPTQPYYEPQGEYKNIKDFSKTLVFSSWEMVPRMITCLASYEAERINMQTLKTRLKNEVELQGLHYFLDDGEENTTKKTPRYPRPRLNFAFTDNRPRGMSLFCLIYPSDFLTKVYDPVACLNERMSLSDIRAHVRGIITEALNRLPETVSSGPVDQRWYYVAPLLLDDKRYVVDWFLSEETDDEEESYIEEDQYKEQRYADFWNEEAETEEANISGYERHLLLLRNLYKSIVKEDSAVLRRRPEDLPDVLTEMALAAPAISVNRTYRLYEDDYPHSYPSKIAKAFINRMNTTEATAVVEIATDKRKDDAHWQNVLRYCVNGNLQAMWDEYAHMITSGMDKSKGIVRKLHNEILNGMNIRATRYSVDTLSSFKKRVKGKKARMMNMRTHFAVAFTRGISKDSDTDRKKSVRNAFNSPFRPFVLASTSIGQEGLDFHNYCRRIVHWNLPRNPIDLEQREGRINRFECLAIRQNVAKRYGSIQFERDVWNELFEEAYRIENGGRAGCSDLIPYWGLSASDNMVKIERIVPMYPFSKDGINYERLIKILSLYRLTLGQARQEELLEYIFTNCDAQQQENLKKLFINLSPFYKKET